MDDIAIELKKLQRVFSYPSENPIKLSYGLLKSVTNHFSREIGRGGFGVVYMGHLKNGKVAVKKLSNPHVLPDKQFLDEITCLKQAKHKNIVRFLGYCSEAHGELHAVNGRIVMAEIQRKLLCFEYVPNGNIRDYLRHEKPHGDNWPTRYQMIRGICHGLHYLHGKKINHLDLKPENVMLDAEMEPKITDFGLSRLFDQGQSKMFTQHIIGTPRYIAPEIIDKGEISFKSDIYALGIIIIELLTGISRIHLENWDESLDEECPRVRRCAEIARNCTDAAKYNRPTACEIINDLDELVTMTPQSSENQNHEYSVLVEPSDVGPVEIKTRTGGVPEVPSWMGSLVNIQELHLQLERVGQGDLGILGGLPALLILNLMVTAESKDRLRVSGAVGFPCLRELRYHKLLFGGMDLLFAPGSMPKLEKLDIMFNAGESDSLSSEAFDLGIGNLPSLVCVECEVRGWLNSAVSAANAYLERTTRTHPNRPTLLLT